jgi:hypothetical protein
MPGYRPHVFFQTQEFNFEKEIPSMSKTMKKILIGAALTGFVSGTTAALMGHPADDAAGDSGKKVSKAKSEKHACKGKNSCKGKGGCGTTKGKNDCKGKGECRTDGKPMT